MRYAPRDRSLVPHMKRLKDSMSWLLTEATEAQTSGEVYTPSSILTDLVEAIDLLKQDDGKKELEPHHRDFLVLAIKLAKFIENLHGVRLRLMSEEEIAELGQRNEGIPRKRKATDTSTAPIKFRPARIMPTILKKSAPRVTCTIETGSTVILQPQTSGASTALDRFDAVNCTNFMEVKEEQGLIKEENLCEVDTTPLRLEPALEPVAKVPEVKREIKEEELDDFHLSPAELDDLRAERKPMMRQLHQQPITPGIVGAVTHVTSQFKRRDGTPLERIDETRLEAFMQPLRKTIAVPSNPSLPSPPLAVRGQKFVLRLPINRFSPGVPEPPRKKMIMNHVPLDSVKPVAASQVATTSNQAASSFDAGRRIVMCNVCREPVEERELTEHTRTLHAVKQRVVLMPPTRTIALRCEDLACDFETDKMRDRFIHTEMIHGDKYREWQSKGRFNLVDGTFCPFCSQLMRNLFQLCKHLMWKHADRMDSQLKIFSCSTCSSRFSRLHEVYEHWNLSNCLGAIRIAQNLPLPIPPSISTIAGASELITGPKGKTGF